MVSLYVSGRLERWHNKRFSEHSDHLRKLAADDWENPEMARKVTEFQQDGRIDRAIDGMVLFRGAGILLLGVAAMVYLGAI